MLSDLHEAEFVSIPHIESQCPLEHCMLSDCVLLAKLASRLLRVSMPSRALYAF